MKYYFICFLLAVVDVAGGQQINIPRTKVFITPPPGFRSDSSYIGLKRDDSHYLLVSESTGINYYKSTANFNRESFEKNKMRVFYYKDTSISGFPAKYVDMQGSAPFRSFTLVFGDSTFSVNMFVSCPSGDEKTINEIKASLSTVVYREKMVTAPFTAALFKLENNTSRFGFATSSGGIYLFSKGGILKNSYGDEPLIYINTLPVNSHATPRSVSDELIADLVKQGMKGIDIRHAQVKDIDRNPGYECEIYGYIDGKEVLILHRVLIKDHMALVIQGTSKMNFDRNINEFRKFAQSVKFK